MVPLWKSHYSIGRSILTLEKPKDVIDGGPDSIISLAVANNLKEIVLVDDNMSGFLQGYVNAKEANLKYIFGLKVNICNDIADKTDESWEKTSKIIIFIKNTNGYKNLLKIYSKAATDGFYYEPRLDYKILNELWTENLLLAIPFYDSFVFNNSIRISTCIPDFSQITPTFFVEDQNLPFDALIKEKVLEFAAANEYEVQNTHSIYYNKRGDFKAYLTFRCINKRTTLEKPNIDHMSSDSFCLEEYFNKIK
ncbi:MAG: PHP domain-containing protein [Nanoarchaeota archaeon]